MEENVGGTVYPPKIGVNWCIFCCKSDWDKDSDRNWVTKFFKLLARYVGGGGSQLLLEGMKDFEKGVEGEREHGGNGDKFLKMIAACQKCEKKVEVFCSLYLEMERIQLQMEGMLEELMKSMEEAGRVPGRLRKMREEFKLEGISEEEDCLRRFKALRKEIIGVCKAKLLKSQPKVVLEAMEPPPLMGPLSFEQSDCLDFETEDDFMMMGAEDDGGDPSKEEKYCPPETPDSQETPPSAEKTSSFDCPSELEVVENKKVPMKRFLNRKRHRNKPGLKKDDKSSYPCAFPECPKQFEREEDLLQHQGLHGSFQCLFCDVTKNHAMDLSEHELQDHPNPEPFPSLDGVPPPPKKSKSGAEATFQCRRCPFRAIRHANYLKHHVESHLGLQIKVLSCDICKAPYLPQKDASDTPSYHFKSHHDTTGMAPEDIQHCNQCPAYFRTLRQLTRHKGRVHATGQVKCPLCHKMVSSYGNLKVHQQAVHHLTDENPALPCPCDVPSCKKRFSSPSELERHKAYFKHDLPPKSFQCSECPRLFSTLASFHNHQKSHRRPPHMCTQCGLTFPRKSTLTRHYLFHLPPDQWAFTCPEPSCSKKCQTRHTLQEHLRTHTKERLFACYLCDRTYSDRQKLRNHVNSGHRADGVEDVARRKAKPKFISRRAPPK